LNTIGKWAVIALLGLAVVFAGWQLNEKYVESRIEKTQVEQQLSIEKNNSKVKDEVVLTEKRLNDVLLKQRKQYEKTVDATISQYVADVAGLSNRPSRNSSGQTVGTETSGDSKGSSGITGAELSREDAEFLTRFARDTEELKIGLLQCYDDYMAGKFAIDKFLDELEPLDELK